MKASVYHGPRDIRVEDVPDATVREPTDALVRVTHACICGSDLWPYRGQIEIYGRPGRTGHEFMGVVEAVGADVSTLSPGDVVISPFAFSDGSCAFCAEGLTTSCENVGYWGGVNDGGQGEAVRVPFADATLVPLPNDVDLSDDVLARRIAPLTDVLCTGHHAAVSAGVAPGSTAVVIGDGAVGLCAVMAAKRLGAERIIAIGHHTERLAIATAFGATDVVSGDDKAAVAHVMEATGSGARSVLECVGTDASLNLAIAAARPGGTIGYVGVPYGNEVNRMEMYGKNVSVVGGVAPARTYMPELLADVLAGKLDPSPVMDNVVTLDGVVDGYKAMDERRSVKTLINVTTP